MTVWKPYTVYKWSDKEGDWRAVRSKQKGQTKLRTKVSRKRAQELLKKGKARNWIVTARPSNKGKPTRPPRGKKFKTQDAIRMEFIEKYLYGDLDAKVDIMFRLAKVAEGLGHRLYVAEGTRSIKDQWKYWIAYKAGRGPLAAFPGTSNHTNGDACDVRKAAPKGTPNIGYIPGARRLMKKYGLCLPVPGEPWHVEIGNKWRA